MTADVMASGAGAGRHSAVYDLRYTISPLLGRLTARAAHRKMFDPSPVAERFAREFPVELALRPSQIRAGAAAAALMIPGAARLARHHSELSLPVAIMAGRNDKIVDCDSQAGRLQTVLADSKLVKVPGTEHMLYHPGTCFTTKSLNRLRPSSARLCKRVSPPRGKPLRGPRNRTV